MKAFRTSGKPLLSLGVLAALTAAPGLALADNDGYCEIQLDVRTLADLLGRSIATQSSFCAQPADIDGRTVIVDHLSLGDQGRVERSDRESMVTINDFTEIESRPVLFTQPVVIHVKTVECALDPECSETSPIEARLTYELFASPAGQLCMKELSAERLPEGVPFPVVQVCLPFRAEDALNAAGLSGDTASGAGVSLDGDGQRVALRVELGKTRDDYDGARVRDWGAFLAGEIQRTGSDGDWSSFVHQSLVLGGIQRRVSSALEAQAGFRVEGPVETHWDAGETGARIDARFNGRLISPFCPEGIAVNEITLSGKVTLDDPESPTSLLTRGELHYDVSAADAAECGLSLGGPVGALILGALSDSISLDMASLGPNCRADGAYQFECAAPMTAQFGSVGPAQFVGSTVKGLSGSASGLAMSGSLETAGEARLSLSGRDRPFQHDGEQSSYEGALSLQGTGRVCDTKMWSRDGDVGMFTLTAPAYAGTPGTYTLSLPANKLGLYQERPFEVMITMMTSAGVRTFAIDPSASLP